MLKESHSSELAHVTLTGFKISLTCSQPTSSSVVPPKSTTAALRTPYSRGTPVRPNSHEHSYKMATPKTEVKDSIELDAQKRLNEIKRKALARYGELPAVSPLPASMTPSSRKGFRPPSMKKR